MSDEMTLVYTRAQYGLPEGRHRVRFLGVKLLEPVPGEPPRIGQNGKPMEPAMAWQFEALDGELAGRIGDRVTTRTPTKRNSCGRMLAAVSGQPFKEGEAVALKPLVGRCFLVNSVTKDNGNGTFIDDLGIAPIAEEATEKFCTIVKPGDAPVWKTRDELEDLVKAGCDPAEVQVSTPGESWRPAVEVFPGLKDLKPLF